MFTPEEEAELRRLLRDRAETRELSPEQIHFSPVGLPNLPQEHSFFWQLIDNINNFPVWLGKTRGGKAVCVVIIGVGIWQSLDWTLSHILYPTAKAVPVVAECIDGFIEDTFGERFPWSGKEKYLAFSNPPHRQVDILIPAASGIVPQDVIETGSPPPLPWRGFNNSQQVARLNAEYIRRQQEQVIRNNRRRWDQAAQAAWLLRQQQQTVPPPVIVQRAARHNAEYIRCNHDQVIRNNRRHWDQMAAAALVLRQQQDRAKNG
jgi:hypothetical protein